MCYIIMLSFYISKDILSLLPDIGEIIIAESAQINATTVQIDELYFDQKTKQDTD